MHNGTCGHSARIRLGNLKIGRVGNYRIKATGRRIVQSACLCQNEILAADFCGDTDISLFGPKSEIVQYRLQMLRKGLVDLVSDDLHLARGAV